MELLGKPFALFGHSMGALVVYELARKLAQDNGVKPILLVVSACRPPNVSRKLQYRPGRGGDWGGGEA